MEFSMFKFKYIVMVYYIISMYTNKYSNSVEAAVNSAVVDRIKNCTNKIDPKEISCTWKKSKYTLIGTGVNDGADIIRILLIILAVDFEYEQLDDDERISLTDKIHVGRLPILEIDSKAMIGQPMAVCRYLSNLAGLNGKNDLEKLIIDKYIGDIVEWHSEVSSYHYDTDEISRDSKLSKLISTTLPNYLKLFNEIVSENKSGYIFGEELSWVDLACINTFNYIKIATDYDVSSENYKALTELSQKVFKFVEKLEKKKNHMINLGNIVNNMPHHYKDIQVYNNNK